MISVDQLSVSFGGSFLFSRISFLINSRDKVGLVGRNGAGKTTLFRILTTLLLPASGSAVVDGYDVVKDYKEIRKRVGYMPGRFSLYQDLSVEENLEMGAYTRTDAKGILEASRSLNAARSTEASSRKRPTKTSRSVSKPQGGQLEAK